MAKQVIIKPDSIKIQAFKKVRSVNNTAVEKRDKKGQKDK